MRTLPRSTRLWYPAVMALMLAAAGCGSSPPPPPVLELQVAATPMINPAPDGGPAPVAVKLFELGTQGKFSAADYFQLSGNAAATLGPDLLGQEDLAVTPGQAKKLTIALKPGTRFVGLAAGFRDIDKAQWRSVAPVAESGASSLVATIDGLTATLAAAK